MKTRLNRQEKEKLSNKTVFFTSCALLYALLLLFIEKMTLSPMTVEGAVGLIQILRWTSLAGAMACAAWSAYKEKKGFYLYCAMCLYVFLSTLILHFVPDNRAYPINYFALGAAFVMGQAYYYLRIAGKLNRGHIIRKLYIATCVVIVLLLALACLPTETLSKIMFWK